VDVSATAALPCPPDVAFAEVADLSTYPAWLSIVHEVVADGDDAWLVSLGARMGPVGRTKRVRMARVVCEAPTHVRFERAERDGRSHSPWVLDAALAASDDATTTLTMSLHYGGSRWLPLLDMVLAQEIHRAGSRLAARLSRRS
jgi:hypothetical protein